MQTKVMNKEKHLLHFNEGQSNYTHNYLQQYRQVITQFNSFREETVMQKEKLYNELEKHKQINENFVKKLQKKYDSLLKEERSKLQKEKEKSKKIIIQQKEWFQNLITQKNQTIQELSNIILELQKQKKQIIQENTKSILQLAKSQDKQISQNQYSSQDILKMYQYLLQENEILKKQLDMSNLSQKRQQEYNRSPNSMKINKKNDFSKKAKEIYYTEQSNKKARSPVSEHSFYKNNSLISNSFIDQKQDKNLHRVKSNTSEHSSKIKKHLNTYKSIVQSAQQFSEVSKNTNPKKKIKSNIPTAPMQKKKPI